ncbi:SDR family oxidoreductase [Pseudomaricurvus alkylphenolicus]|nr:SDR family oxidoreductase [Pseudomaricurvus alkylphenolicus]
MSFYDKVALVTGAGSGIGQATAIAFAKRGANVVAADVDTDGLKMTKSIAQEYDGSISSVRVDAANSASVEEMISTATSQFGRLDYACNIAGITGTECGFTDCTEENWDKVINVNLKGVWLCMKYQLRQMLKQGHGSIVNMSSVAGLVGMNDRLAPYGPSKFGVVGLTKSAALEFARQNIRINAVCPGEIMTPMQEAYIKNSPELETKAIDSEPIGRFGIPDEVAEAVLWLCSDAASFVTGHAMAIDGGYVAQ